MAEKFAVSFGSPHAGWLRLNLQVGDAEVSLTPSYTPNDFLEELISAVSSAASYDGAFSAIAFEEPDRVAMVLTRRGDEVELSVYRRPDAEPVFTYSSSVASVVLPIWRALRQLQTDPRLGEWQRPFPIERMLGLSLAAERLKSSAT